MFFGVGVFICGILSVVLLMCGFSVGVIDMMLLGSLFCVVVCGVSVGVWLLSDSMCVGVDGVRFVFGILFCGSVSFGMLVFVLFGFVSGELFGIGLFIDVRIGVVVGKVDGMLLIVLLFVDSLGVVVCLGGVVKNLDVSCVSVVGLGNLVGSGVCGNVCVLLLVRLGLMVGVGIVMEFGDFDVIEDS